MKLQDFLNSRAGIALGLSLSRLIQPGPGYTLAKWLADLIASRKKSAIVRAVRANQWVVHGQKPSGQQLQQLARATFRSTARSLYEFWHYHGDDQKVLELVEMDDSFRAVFNRAKSSSSGTFFVAPHISNFDLVARSIVLRGLPVQVLSYPQPPGGYQWQNELRSIPGMELTPISVQALQKATQTLRSGGTVITGVDRPLENEDAKYKSHFFGRLAALPVFHIRLALKLNLPITVLSACRLPDGSYRIYASDPIPMKRDKDLVRETVQNAEAVLSVIADFIRAAPEQWAMFYPVWPEAQDQMPD
ncbi:MAG: hypothetical protein GX491_02260 [Chloroflexi bacterium]|nr:hypothetical protein [Chloroflexota bacterium]